MMPTQEAKRDKPDTANYVHLFDALMTISSTAKALTEEVMELASKDKKGGTKNAAENT